MCRITRWHRKTGKRYADHARLSDKDADVVEIGAIARQSARLQLPELRGRLGDRLFALGDDQQRVAGGHDGIGCWNEILAALANHGPLDVAQHSPRSIVEFP